MATVDIAALRRLHDLASNAGHRLGDLLICGERLAEVDTVDERADIFEQIREHYFALRGTDVRFRANAAAQAFLDAANADHFTRWEWPNGGYVVSGHAWLLVTAGMVSTAETRRFDEDGFQEWLVEPEPETIALPDDDEFTLPDHDDFLEMIDAALEAIDPEHLVAVKLLLQCGGKADASEGAADAIKPRQKPKASLDARALAIFIENTDLTKTEIAQRLGCHEKSLAPRRCPKLHAAIQASRSKIDPGRRIVRGSRAKDGDIEAWEG